MALCGYRLSVRMRVPEQHARIAMAADERHLQHTQALLKELANGFVTQIVKPAVCQTRPLHEPLPCHLSPRSQ